jgi:cysteine-rich repeat protein
MWALGLALASCASQDNVKVCTAAGQTYLCPEDTACGVAPTRCVRRADCGDGVIDLGEACDDGNTRDGDGCSHDCRSTEVCGNGILDQAAGEVCDDGNTRGGDGCSHDCKSLEVCGNQIVDREAGEVCDDGNTLDGDGCSRDCRSTEVCGNRILDPGEVCDDGPVGSARCSTNCRSNLTCNNLVVDPGEECDHGPFGSNNPTGNHENNDCRGDCVINRCGDGYVNTQPGPHREDCDGAIPAARNSVEAHPVETAGCNLDCTFARCGDGKVNRSAGEQCDDGNTADGDGCSATCRFEICGDGIVNNGEACDRALSPATCNFDCTISICGDGKANPSAIPPEQCDDGNLVGGDGCSPTCRFE